MEMTVEGLVELKRAVARNPKKVLDETGKFLVRGIAVYNRGIIRSPWKTHGSEGGAPVSSGNLRDTHQKEIAPWQARIYTTAPYARYVHDGTKYMSARPWLNYVQESSDPEIEKLEKNLLDNIINDLAK